MIYDEKLLLRWNKELIEIHKKCITTQLSLLGIPWTTRKKFFILYDNKVSTKNIRKYYNLKVPIFIKALIRDELDNTSYYTDKEPTEPCRKLKIRRRKKKAK